MATRSVTLALEGISKRFGAVEAVKNVSLTLESPGIVAVLGPNGAGKTTLLDMICGLLRPDEGSIHMDSREISGMRACLTSRLGIVRGLQRNRLIEKMSVAENMLLSLPYCKRDWLSSALLGRWLRSKGDAMARVLAVLEYLGIDDIASRQVAQLSYGQKRFVMLACLLASEPRILLLDEPSAGLGTTWLSRLAHTLLDVASDDILIILVEHNIQFVQNVASRIVAMDRGVLVRDARLNAADFEFDVDSVSGK